MPEGESSNPSERHRIPVKVRSRHAAIKYSRALSVQVQHEGRSLDPLILARFYSSLLTSLRPPSHSPRVSTHHLYFPICGRTLHTVLVLGAVPYMIRAVSVTYTCLRHIRHSLVGGVAKRLFQCLVSLYITRRTSKLGESLTGSLVIVLGTACQ